MWGCTYTSLGFWMAARLCVVVVAIQQAGHAHCGISWLGSSSNRTLCGMGCTLRRLLLQALEIVEVQS